MPRYLESRIPIIDYRHRRTISKHDEKARRLVDRRPILLRFYSDFRVRGKSGERSKWKNTDLVSHSDSNLADVDFCMSPTKRHRFYAVTIRYYAARLTSYRNPRCLRVTTRYNADTFVRENPVELSG